MPVFVVPVIVVVVDLIVVVVAFNAGGNNAVFSHCALRLKFFAKKRVAIFGQNTKGLFRVDSVNRPNRRLVLI